MNDAKLCSIMAIREFDIAHNKFIKSCAITFQFVYGYGEIGIFIGAIYPAISLYSKSLIPDICVIKIQYKVKKSVCVAWSRRDFYFAYFTL